MYQLIRVKDDVVVEILNDEEKANLYLFFYDSPEEPHIIKGPKY